MYFVNYFVHGSSKVSKYLVDHNVWNLWQTQSLRNRDVSHMMVNHKGLFITFANVLKNYYFLPLDLENFAYVLDE